MNLGNTMFTQDDIFKHTNQAEQDICALEDERKYPEEDSISLGGNYDISFNEYEIDAHTESHVNTTPGGQPSLDEQNPSCMEEKKKAELPSLLQSIPNQNNQNTRLHVYFEGDQVLEERKANLTSKLDLFSKGIGYFEEENISLEADSSKRSPEFGEDKRQGEARFYKERNKDLVIDETF